jgi:hypothetical protein
MPPASNPGARWLALAAKAPLLPDVDNRTGLALRARHLAAELAASLGREPSALEWSALLDAALLALRLRDSRLADDQRVTLGFALDAALRRAGVQPARPQEPAREDARAEAMAKAARLRRGEPQ